jgi:hypothetical protein
MHKESGRGIHVREVPGLEKLKSLPSEGYAFTKLELTIGPGQSREIDIVMMIEDRNSRIRPAVDRTCRP